MADARTLIGSLLLRTRHPWILCEMHSETNDAAARASLASLGYSLEAVDANHLMAKPTRES